MASDMGDLRRETGKGLAIATCIHRDFGGDCQFRVTDVWPETAATRARKHARESGHITRVEYKSIIEYTPEKRATDGE